MSKVYENGIVATTTSANSYITTDLITTGAVYWVDSVNGNDSNSGLLEAAPKATLASAITAATDNNGDIIILKASHAETLTSAITIDKSVRIFGLGSGSSKPSFTANASSLDVLDVTSDNVWLYGLRFPAGTTAANASRINCAAEGLKVVDCDFICGVYDLESITLASGATNALIKSSTFTVSADGPDAAIEIEHAGVNGLVIDSCTFDGGTYNFDAAAINSGVAHLNYNYINVILTNQASIIHSAAAKGTTSGIVAGDGSHVEI